jgi:hypothetical protein
MKTKIRLKLKIKDVELELSKEEVIQLKDLLNDLFPPKEIVRELPYYPYTPYRPLYWEYKEKIDRTPVITWCHTGQTSTPVSVPNYL